MAFVYISNYDETHADKWKELIPFYNLEGMHILANSELTEDIMKKSGGQGFPTYIVVKKDGTYELSKGGYPLNRRVLIRQIEENL